MRKFLFRKFSNNDFVLRQARYKNVNNAKNMRSEKGKGEEEEEEEEEEKEKEEKGKTD